MGTCNYEMCNVDFENNRVYPAGVGNSPLFLDESPTGLGNVMRLFCNHIAKIVQKIIASTKKIDASYFYPFLSFMAPRPAVGN